jgi:hypothetical protein
MIPKDPAGVDARVGNSLDDAYLIPCQVGAGNRAAAGSSDFL